MEVVDYGLSGSDTPTWSRENEKTPLRPIETVDSHHETILVFIVDFQTDYTGFIQEARVISDDVSICVRKQSFHVSSANNIYPAILATLGL